MKKYNKMVVDWRGEYNQNDKKIGENLVKEMLETLEYEKYTKEELKKIEEYYEIEEENRENTDLEEEYNKSSLSWYDSFEEFLGREPLEIQIRLYKKDNLKIFECSTEGYEGENWLIVEIFYKNELVESSEGAWDGGDFYEDNYFEDFCFEDLKIIQKLCSEYYKTDGYNCSGFSELDEYIKEKEERTELEEV